MSRISTRLGIIFLVFVVLLGANFLFTSVKMSTQKDDGLVVNLAGRQRMLTQKMSKEALQYAAAPTAALKAGLQKTVDVFDKTLTALAKGGEAPTNLAMTESRQCPAATGESLGHMEKVAVLWAPFKAKVLAVAAEPADKVSLGFVTANNVALLKAMNAGVVSMQGDSETKVGGVSQLQIILLIVGLLLAAGGFVVVRSSISKPLSELTVAAAQMTAGQVDRPIDFKGAAEITELSQSFERLRMSVAAMMQASDEIGDLDDDDGFDEL